MTRRGWIMLFVSLLPSGAAYAQLQQIDPAKLPPDERVKTILAKVSPLEPLIRGWSPNWTYDTPKEHVVSTLTSSLQDLRSLEEAAPGNEEIFLLTGLVAHFAYNVDIEGGYDTAVQSLEKAHKLAPDDYRAAWFLGNHLCQANEAKSGMEHLLAVEHQLPWQQLPLDFWDDYIFCSSISLMPAHTLRAVDRAEHLGAPPSAYSQLVDIAHKRYKTTDADSAYPAHDAWEATKGERDVEFTSQVCGMRFSAHADWRTDIKDVTKGTCIAMLNPGPYRSKLGNSSPTLLVLTRIAKPQETLDDFAAFWVKEYPTARRVTPPSCPSDKCVGYEIVTNAMYQSKGGAHFLVVAFAGNPADFPGLVFEKPEEPPKTESAGNKPVYYRAIEKLHRFPGVLHTVVMLDSNESIFGNAEADFQYLLKSIQIN